MSKLVIIDGHAIMHRAYHAIPNLKDKMGNPTNAVYGLISMLLRITQDLGPTHLVVCFDRPEETFRKKEFKNYQAHRPEVESSLASQFDVAKEVLGSMNVVIFEKAGYEADDLIGTIARKARGRLDGIIIVTGDRDILQLVSDRDNITLYMPVGGGIANAKVFGEKETFERMGVAPSQIVDYKALVGDPSDNYPGVHGIGPKTAESLLSKYKTKDGVYKNLDNINEKIRKVLKDGMNDADISYKLAKIDCNVPIKVDFTDLAKWDLYNSSSEEAFDNLGFKSLKERVKKVARMKMAESQGKLFN